MKKIISIMMLAVMMLTAFALTACGGGESSEDVAGSKYVGTWKASALTLGEESGTIDDEYLLILNEDGTGHMTGEDTDGEFTWSLTSNGFKTKGDVKMKFTDDGDNIKTTILGVAMIFERQ